MMNFAEAALLIQGSTCIYGRKVSLSLIAGWALDLAVQVLLSFHCGFLEAYITLTLKQYISIPVSFLNN